MVKEISSEEVKKHRDEKSVWMVIHNDVYDVTSFLEEHPGGAESLLEVAGEDGTQGFEDVGHSEDARELMKKYKIGTLPASEIKTTKKEMHSSEISTNLKWAIIALAGAILVGIAIRKYMR